MSDQSGPPDTRPPSGPSTPPPPPAPKLAADLDHAELLLRSVQLLADRLTGMDPALRVQLDSGLRTARRAVAAAQSPGRRDHVAAAVAPAIATTGGPGRAGEPPLPGAHFTLPRRRELPRFEVGVGRLYDALPAVNGSLARRAD